MQFTNSDPFIYSFAYFGGNPNIEKDGGERGKRQHVSNWISAFPNAKLYIYAGNGRNDILAMRKVLEQKNGYVICPKNSRTQVKEMASIVSEKEDIDGIISNLKMLNGRFRTPDLDDDGDR